MRPALSIIVFTTCSGTGYGLLFLLGLAGPLGLLPAERWFGGAGMALALLLVSAGLVSSTFHLGHPERAWRAVSQWRSSWLSREGVAALLTYIPAVVFGAAWIVREGVTGPWAVAGILAALGAVATVVCTGMIYASLPPVRQWHNRWTVPCYLGFAAMGGGLWLVLLTEAFGYPAAWPAFMAIALVLTAWALKGAYWRYIDHLPPGSTPETATGLGDLGIVRLLDPPHTQSNYLLHEMAYRVARKHAARLRRIALAAGLVAPIPLFIVALATEGWIGIAAAAGAVIGGMLGVLVERWLFFAEARHTVTLYYGDRAA